jgi:8-oxo-dGTP pyrophosphatase MutT (NUDIX family)
MKPGFGVRHPAVAALLASEQPVASKRIAWLNGRLPLQVSAYTSIHGDLPDAVLTSIRCLVRVGDRIVMCENRDGERHLMPGGRRIAGESFADTALREVHEETGWMVERASLRALGWLHLHNLNAPPIDSSLPYPDFLQLVMCGCATERDGGVDANWTDVEGYEISSRLVSITQAQSGTPDELFERIFLNVMLAG